MEESSIISMIPVFMKKIPRIGLMGAMFLVLMEQLMRAMIEYEAGNARRIQHFLKVLEFAVLIAKHEGVDARTMEILQAAALVHDCGIKPSMEKYKSAGGEYQQKEGPLVAEPMLRRIGFDEELIERVCYLVAHHHTYTNIDGLDYQILVEADFLVNMYEENQSIPQVIHVRGNVFRTVSGIWLLDEMYLPEVVRKMKAENE